MYRDFTYSFVCSVLDAHAAPPAETLLETEASLAGIAATSNCHTPSSTENQPQKIMNVSHKPVAKKSLDDVGGGE